MIKIKDKPDSSKDIKELLHPFVREWFFKNLKTFLCLSYLVYWKFILGIIF